MAGSDGDVTIIKMIPGSKGLKSDAGLPARGFLNLGPAKNMKKQPDQGGFGMFLRIAGVQRTEQSGIRGVKRPFDPNIIKIQIEKVKGTAKR
ncbi:hypothetical protein D3Z50_00225 [Clostridiaceae bacterium]|jgi:hypothetical protein|nr:hypothetical protein [Clostridiaceae bacterium]